MSRLQYHRKKQLNATIIFMIVAILLVLYFIFTVGVKLLLSASVFVAEFTGSRKNVPTAKVDDFYGNLSVDSIPVATNSSKFIVSGSLLNFDTLDFFLNEDKIKQTSITTAESFNEELDGLKKGENTLYLKAKTKDNKQEKKTKLFTILYKSEKPKLEILEPKNGSKTSKTEIKIIGKTDKETFVKLNQLPIVTDPQGNFQTFVRLQTGENKIEIIAQDVAGNIEAINLSVTYQKDD